MTTETIAPHGGALVRRFVGGAERARWLARVGELPRITLTRREISDLEMIAIGTFSPLDGFMGQHDYDSVVTRMRLASGLPWTIPVTLAVTEREATSYHVGDDVALVEEGGKPLAILHLAETYRPDKRREASEVYLTTEEAHPGVKAVYEMGDVYLGGKVTALDRPSEIEFQEHRLDPAQLEASQGRVVELEQRPAAVEQVLRLVVGPEPDEHADPGMLAGQVGHWIGLGIEVLEAALEKRQRFLGLSGVVEEEPLLDQLTSHPVSVAQLFVDRPRLAE
jgi:hypothetical protein